jgi:hypothetical protein
MPAPAVMSSPRAFLMALAQSAYRDSCITSSLVNGDMYKFRFQNAGGITRIQRDEEPSFASVYPYPLK